MTWWRYGQPAQQGSPPNQNPQSAGSYAPAGGVVSQRPDQGSAAPASTVAPSQAAGTLRARVVIVSGTSAGVFVYNGNPGVGTLIASVTDASTDPYGNATETGLTAYSAGHDGTNVQVSDGGILFNQTSVTAAAVIGSNSTAGLILSSGQAVAADPECSLDLLPGSSGGLPELTIGVSGDGTVYSIGEAVYFNPASQSITSATPAVITGLSQAVGATSYYFRGVWRMKQGATNVDQLIGFSGPATSYCVWYYSDGGQGSTSTSQKVVVGSLTTVSIGIVAASDEQYVEFEGTVTFSATGTFACVAAEGTAGDSWTVQPGCVFVVRPI